ncbi:MAG: DUF2523 family protein [Pseudomonadota bacterium]
MSILTVPLGAFLEAFAAPIVRKVLAGLGLGILVFTIISTTLAALIAMAQTYYGGITGFAAGIIGLAGFGETFGIVSGALTFKAVLASGKVFGVVS